MCVRPMRFHATGSAGCCGSKWKISITAPPGIRIQPILQVAPGTSTPKNPRTRSAGASDDADERAAEHVPVETHGAVEVRTVMPMWLNDRAFISPGLEPEVVVR